MWRSPRISFVEEEEDDDDEDAVADKKAKKKKPYHLKDFLRDQVLDGTIHSFSYLKQYTSNPGRYSGGAEEEEEEPARVMTHEEEMQVYSGN